MEDGLHLGVWHCIALDTFGHEAFLLSQFLTVHWFGRSLGKTGREVPCLCAMPVCRCMFSQLMLSFFFLSFCYWLLKKFFSAMFYDLKKNPVFSSLC